MELKQVCVFTLIELGSRASHARSGTKALIGMDTLKLEEVRFWGPGFTPKRGNAAGISLMIPGMLRFVTVAPKAFKAVRPLELLALKFCELNDSLNVTRDVLRFNGDSTF